MDRDLFLLFLDVTDTPFGIRRSTIDSVEYFTDDTTRLLVRGGMYSESPTPREVKGSLVKVLEILNKHLETFPTTNYVGEMMGHDFHIRAESK